MSGLPESGQGWAIYEYATSCGNLVVLPPGPKSPPAKCRDPSAAQSSTAAERSNCVTCVVARSLKIEVACASWRRDGGRF
jgi:hypothetical protein